MDNIRSTHNVGSIFRTSDALGIKNIILCGTTPAPVDRFGRERKDVTKVSLGAEKSVVWKYEKDTVKILKKFKKENYKIIAIEQAENSVDYKKVKIKNGENLVFVVGEEVKGVNPEVLEIADVIVEIPMRGLMVRQAHHPCNIKQGKESLNVSVSFGVAMFRILNI